MRLVAFVVLVALGISALAACPSPKMPKGPPPEYEDPPPPASVADAGSSSEAGPTAQPVVP